MSLLLNNDTVKIQSYTVNSVGDLYNVVCYLEFFANDSTEPYTRKPISLDGLAEKELTFKEFYKRLSDLPDFEGSTKI